MKTLSTILLALVLVALCVGDCVAQSSSSTSQTVTFGVRRIATPSLAANLSQVSSDGESTTLDPAPLKVTVGSDIHSDEFVVGVRTSAVKKMRRQQTMSSDQLVAVPESPNSYRSTSLKSVITVTE